MIVNIPKILKAMLESLGPSSGWYFTVVCGGPNPAHPNGDIRTLSYNYGTGPSGLTFRDTYLDVHTTLNTAFTKFLRSVFGEYLGVSNIFQF